MELHVVIQTIGGFAREDADQVNVIGVYEDSEIADFVRKCASLSANVQGVTLNAIPPGFLKTGKEFGFRVPEVHEEDGQLIALPACNRNRITP